MSLEEKLKDLNQSLCTDIRRKLPNTSQLYIQRLQSFVSDETQQLDKSHWQQIAIAYYNISYITNNSKYLKRAIKYCQKSVEVMHWNLQLIALISSCGSHAEAYEQSITMMKKLMLLLEKLPLERKEQLLRRQIIEVMDKKQDSQNSSEIALQHKIKQYTMSQKFPTDCHLINKKFHIADLMTIEPILESQPLNQAQSNEFLILLVYLSVLCFTRATQRYYCHLSDEKQFHLKAMKIASYIYSQKSSFLRFLKRTFLDHYKKDLFLIEEVEEDGDNIRRKIEIDPCEISLMKLPWEEN